MRARRKNSLVLASAFLVCVAGCGSGGDIDDASVQRDGDLEDGDGGLDADVQLDVDVDAGDDAGDDADADRAPRVPYEVSAGALRVETGEALFLRGLNLSQVSKDIEGHLYPLTEDDVTLIRRRGFNSVRLLTFWEAIMPEGPGSIDVGYVEGFAGQVALLAEGGLFVVVDMHQDLWGRPFGDGAPEWACPEDLRAGYEPVDPWWHNYMSPQVNGCFDNFWGDPTLQAELVDSWVAVIDAVCHHPNVVGIDPMNEPWPGNELGAPRFDNEVLLPFYLRVMEAVEATCPGRVYFLEPTLAYGLGVTDALEIPVDLRDRIVLSPHFYPPMVHEPGDGYDGDADALEHTLLFFYGEFLGQGTPLWIGEYGGITTNPAFDAYFEDISTLFLRHHLGSALWEYSEGATSFSFLSTEGAPRDVFASAARVPVPTLLPAPPTRIEPDMATGELSLELECATDRQVVLLLPEEAPEECTVPYGVGLIVDTPAEEGTFSGRCEADGPVTITCP